MVNLSRLSLMRKKDKIIEENPDPWVIKISEFMQIKPFLLLDEYSIVIVNKGDMYIENSYIAALTGLTVKDYRKVLIKEYNAYKNNRHITFRTMEECFRACEFVQSMMVMEALKNKGGW